ncbi:dienelactone hydrolase family protein [Rufibacter sediminis]|uniref:Dienelactone hydrolase family protein n=1 Tax=Rufibacter sediminis TaxID=2762756 RepID=A0ABR6VQ42_9BACT|nr:dienelactone hydrolase family protein [Rufibacter sediminis]MBC3539315.1 dienelactone hydrolase family protein [Rufibacter sediminis]
MTNHDFITLQVSDGTAMEAYVAVPAESGPVPAIILLQEAFGVNGHIRNIAERLCQEGYAVIAPDLFHRTVKRLEASYADFASVMPHYQALTQDGLSADLKASYDWLQQQPTVQPGKTGSIGFCLGGRVSFLANAVLPLSAAVSYYGGGTDTLAHEAVNLHAPQLFFWGGKDVHIPQEKIDTVINAVKAAGKDYINTVISYADHGFHCDERASYHPLAAREAWATTLAFFENRLKK